MRQHTLGWFSSYDRGLQHALKMWPVIKEKYPDAQFHVFYGWELFDKGFADNPERMAWKERINKLMEQEGVTHHGRVSKKELRSWQERIGIWFYPTHFQETNCITALDCQLVGCVPMTMDLAGLQDSVQSGFKIKGDIYEEEVQKEYMEKLFELMSNVDMCWKAEQKKGKEFAQKYSWENIAKLWLWWEIDK